MDKSQVIDLLNSNGLQLVSEERLPNDLGDKLICSGGEIVLVYDSGKCVAQGKNLAAVRGILGQTPQIGSGPARAPHAGRNVFVVYGHDKSSRDKLEAMLRRWGLTPLILDQLPSEGQTIIEKLESAQGMAHFGVVLATPDDVGYRADHEDEKASRARQNVVLELGMLLTELGRRRVAILLKDQGNMERPSDIHGLIYIPFKDDVDEAKLILAKEINAQGIPIDLGKL